MNKYIYKRVKSFCDDNGLIEKNDSIVTGLSGGAEDAGDEGTDLVLEYIYRHQEEFKLIFCCSAGTEYETYFDRLAAKEEYYYKQFVKQFSDGGHPIDDFFIHVYCRNGWQYVYELITHDKSYEEAKEFMANVRAFNYAGWQAVIGMKF